MRPSALAASVLCFVSLALAADPVPPQVLKATARMRIWRGLKGLGCAALRDAAWLLPDTVTTRQGLAALADETRAAGGSAWLLRLDADDSQSAAFREMFDRTAEIRRPVGGPGALRPACRKCRDGPISL